MFDVFAFLSECFTEGLNRAWDRRGRFKELRSQDSEGPIIIELQYREQPGTPLITYHLEIDETQRGPIVKREFLRWSRAPKGKRAAPFHFLDYQNGKGRVISGEHPEAQDQKIENPLRNGHQCTLGQLGENPRVIALRNFITSWHLSYLSADAARGRPEAGAEERLSPTGDNLGRP